MLNGQKIIDADAHVREPGDLLLKWLEPKYKDRAPQFVPGGTGGYRYGDEEWPQRVSGSMGAGSMEFLETTFKEETETDLFGEQVVLCGGVSALIKASFETLVEAGYQPESAYFECLHEVKLIVDLIYQGGLGYMRYSVSDTAEYGDYTRGGRIVDDHVRESMKKILGEIQDGTFARQWIAENREGRTNFDAMRKKDAEHPVEVVGEELRDMMSFLSKPT